ncbi:ribosomal protein L7/L12 C-terminal domain-containing protein [Entophlyctis helioformis]|nr:ribosomal protein L7/L12 C-terminal domain-containing protein [Entophlyctis helioformis]
MFRIAARSAASQTARYTRSFSVTAPFRQAAETAAAPAAADGDAKITKIVDQIAKLNLLETASLVSALKTRLNISDVVMAAPASAPAASGAPAAAAGAAAAAAAPEKPAEQTSFKVTLAAFDAAAKAKVIKEIKALLPGASLVEAKKFVEGAPKVVRDSAPKEEAEKIKKLLESVGATVTLE